jgi:2-keto-4-pentenoate hydratase/2-oxohepta-3-ene-1,7-dioic acid hydratase in catechol pathway
MLTSGTGAGVAIEGGSEGPNWLKPGDVVSIMLEGAGTLTNVIGDW